MTKGDFDAASRTGLPSVALTVDNNPDTKTVPVITGIYMLASNKGKVYLWDGGDALYLRLDRTVGLVKYYSIVSCTQDPTAFATLLND